MVLCSLWSQGGGTSVTSSIRYVLSITSILDFFVNCSRCLHRLLGQTGVFGGQHASLFGFSVAADINSNVVVFCFLVWSPSRLLCRVGCASKAAATIGRHVHENHREAPNYAESHRLRPEFSMALLQKPQNLHVYTFYHKRNSLPFFDILLTVHLNIFILILTNLMH